MRRSSMREELRNLLFPHTMPVGVRWHFKTFKNKYGHIDADWSTQQYINNYVNNFIK